MLKVDRFSLVSAGVAVGYVAILAGYVTFGLLPQVRMVEEETRDILEVRAEADARVDALGDLVGALQDVVGEQAADGSEATASAARIEEIREAARPFFLPAGPANRGGGDRMADFTLEAAAHEADVASGAVLALTFLERGDVDGARAELENVSRSFPEAVHTWADAREAESMYLEEVGASLDRILIRGGWVTGLWAFFGLVLAGTWTGLVVRRSHGASAGVAPRSAVVEGSSFLDRFGPILEASATPVMLIDPDTMSVVATNKRAREDMGVDQASLEGMAVGALWGGQGDTVERVLREVADGGVDRGVFFADQHVGADRRRVEVTVLGIADDQSNEILAIVRDLSERHRLEQFNERLAHFAVQHGRTLQQGDLETACREVTEMAAELLDVGTAAVWFVEPEGLRCGDAFDARSGTHDHGAFIGTDEAPSYFRALRAQRTIAASNVHTHPATRELKNYFEATGVDALLDVPIRRGGELIGVICHEWHDGPRPWTVEEQVLAGAIGDLVLQAVESSEREETERRLAASEHRYRSIFESASIGIAESDRGGYIKSANAVVCQMLGYSEEELRALTFHDLTHPDDLEFSMRAVNQFLRNERDSYTTEKRYVRKDKTTLWAKIQASSIRAPDGTLTSFVVTMRDRTAEKELEDQLAHAQRMESIGRLAGGIAHDFNNVLTTVLGNAELARARLPKTSQAARQVEAIEDSARHASGLTQQLLTFARRDVVRSTLVELDRLARGSEQLLRRLIGEDVELTTDLDASGALIRIDPQQFDQVLMNLTVNARDAMPEGGKVTIRTRVVPASDVPEIDHSATVLEFLLLEIADEGHGMSEAVMARVFEPFYTTKEPGEGTGLGLATCYGIVSEAGGTIRVQSEHGVGSIFSVLLPRAEGVADPIPEVVSFEPVASDGRTVLVIEDAAPVRELIVEMLRNLGYAVLEATNGAEGVEAAHAHIGPIDLCISDIVMPTLSGPDAVDQIRAKRPGLPVLFISGYSADSRRDEALAVPDTYFLAKPFTPSELMGQIQHVLGRPDADSAVPAS